MSDIAIRVEDLSKQYRIGGAQAPYQTFRDALVQTASAPVRWLRGERPEQNTIWALDNVSFEVKKGEAVGIIGRNGAGKSTLLKILSRITRPTRGRVDLYGRVGSLLEVGTGFHPELTGRENIFLNGAILGMIRREIERKFDEIVNFAEIEKFLDTPVKHYSSGMYVRLAFAVAAHLEPEILVVDEVLAVGDSEFQKKCLGKMGEVAHGGRTVLFVSHNMAAIQKLCSQSIWIDRGKLRQYGSSAEVIGAYLRRGDNKYLAGDVDLSTWSNRYGNGDSRILSARIFDKNQTATRVVHRDGFMAIEFDFENRQPRALHLSLVITSDTGERILHLSHHDTPKVTAKYEKAHYRACFVIPNLPLCAGNYNLALGIHTENLSAIDVVLDVLPFVAEDMINTPRPYKTIKEYAYCWTPNSFSITKLDQQHRNRSSQSA